MAYNYDPELADIVPLLPQGSLDDPGLARDNIVEMLAAFNAGIDTEGLYIRDQLIPGYEDAPEIGLRIYSPAQQLEKLPAVLFIHGGGFVVGDLDTEHGSAVSLARDLGVVVVSVDYRLAPEDPYPAGLDDCFGALKWLYDNGDKLKVDVDRIAVYGQSAGGGLAAALALRARDEKGPKLCFQFLGMPELDDRLQTVSMTNFIDTPMWHRPNAELSWQYYLGKDYQRGAENIPVYAAPARAKDLGGLPPAYVTAMEFDPLRDEAIIYGLRLLECGVAVELHTFPGTFHGSSMMAHAAISRRQQEEALVVLARALDIEKVEGSCS